MPSNPEVRTGTPQSRHVHVLLGGGLNALAGLLPDFETELDDAGAVRARVGFEVRTELPGFDPFPRRDLGWDMLCMTRPLLEFVVRRGVARQGNIVLRSRCRVAQFLASPDLTAVTGVRFDGPNGDPTTLAADLVIDASSRGALTLELLDSIGIPRPEETKVGVDIGYATATFEALDAAPRDWLALIHRPAAPESGRAAIILPIENGRWHVVLGSHHGDVPPDDFQGFVAFAKSLRTPTVYNAIKSTTPVGKIHRFAFPSSIRRHFERLQRFPGGLIPIGDAICRFNPAFGQGMSVAAQEAGALKQLLDAQARSADPLDGLARAFFAAIQDVLAAPWSVAEADFAYPETQGECPADFQQRLQY